MRTICHFIITLQSAEKSLKAAWYAKDANKMDDVKHSNHLTRIAEGNRKVLEITHTGLFMSACTCV